MKVVHYFCDLCHAELVLEDDTGEKNIRCVIRATSPSTAGAALWSADLCGSCLESLRKDLKPGEPCDE